MEITHRSSVFGETNESPTTTTWKAWGFLDFLVMKAGVVANIEIYQNEEGQLRFDIACGCLVDHYTINSCGNEEREVNWLLALYVITWRQLRFNKLSDDELDLGQHAAKQLGIENWQPTTRSNTPALSEVSFGRCAQWALCATMGFKVNVFDYRASRESIVSALAELDTARPRLKQLEMLLGL